MVSKCYTRQRIVKKYNREYTHLTLRCFFLASAIVLWSVPLVRNQEVTGSNPTPVRFESNVSALSELSINCTMAWVADRQVRAMLYANLVVT